MSVRENQSASAHRDWLFTLWLAWLVFVVYGSLVPLEFQRVPWAAAWERFAGIELLDVGLQGRGDWVSNGVLYVPVGLLSMLLLVQGRGWPRWQAAVATVVLACVLAVGVEFAQIYFPPRTVSLNDLLAEGLGALAGVVLAWSARRWWPALEGLLAGKAEQLQPALLPAMLMALVLLALFPFDFLLSTQELEGKLDSGMWGWWRAAALQEGGALASLARWGVELVVTVPMGYWWAGSIRSYRPRRRSAWFLGALTAGALVGLLVETAQLFVASGVTQGASVLSRSVGWALGAGLWRGVGHWSPVQWRSNLRRHTPWLAVTYAVGLALLTWGLSGDWRSPSAALARLTTGEIRFVPFYYHYYTSEAVALQSLLSAALLYVPIGVLGWAWGWRGSLVAIAAGGLALVVELIKLFPEGARPDPTNVGIAAAAAVLTRLGLQWLGHGDGRVPDSRPDSTGAAPRLGRLVAVVLAGGAATLWLVNFPLWQAGLTGMLALSAALVWWRPVALLGLVVLALPLLNLSLWSGWEYVDEFDVVVGLCLVAALASPRAAPRTGAGHDGWLDGLLWAVMASMALAAVVGWAPWQPEAWTQPGSLLSSWGALKLFKGAAWAMALYLVVRRQWAAGWPVFSSLAAGMVLGLLGVSAWVLWERWVFVGWWDASVPYRVAGPVVPMRMGGAYLDVFLIAALAFAWSGAFRGGRVGWRLLCGLALLGGLYAVAVTYTRTTYLAAGVVALLLILLRRRASRRPPGAWSWGFLMFLVPVLWLMSHFAAGSFAQARWASVRQDLGTRWIHMQAAVDIAHASGHNLLWGRGLGRYPADRYWVRAGETQVENRVAVHAFTRENGRGLLQISPGNGLYVDQAISLPAHASVTFSLQTRSAGEGGRLRLMVCEKWLLASAECARTEVTLLATEGAWMTLSSNLSLSGLQGSDRPIRFGLANSGQTRIDIDAIELRDSSGADRLRNGDFEAGGEHWTYTSDDHLAWHVKNMPLAVWYQMGWLGVLTLGAMLGMALWRGARAALQGSEQSAVGFAALTGVLIASVFDAVVDEPRYLLLLLLLAWTLAMGKFLSKGRAN